MNHVNKEQILKLLSKLNFPKDEYYVLSGASMVIRGIRKQAKDLDLCISKELFKKIKDKYSLSEDKKNEYGFYHISDLIEVVVNNKEDFNMEVCNPYNLEDLNTILKFKIKRNTQKDQIDIEKIKEYLKKSLNK